MYYICLLCNVDQKSEDEIEDELDASFRISVFKLPIHPSDSLKYATVLKEKGQDSFSTYAQPFSTTHQKKIIKRKDKLLEKNVRKFLITQKTGIKLQTLYDIDKYYSKQKKQESHEKKVMAVTMAKDAEESVSLTVRESSSKKKYAAQRRKAKDDLTIQCGLQKLWQDKFNYLEKVRERRALFLEEKKQKAEERLLIQNLNNERAILAKGMINMDRLNKKEAVLREKSLIVQQKLEREKYLKELRKYMKDLR